MKKKTLLQKLNESMQTTFQDLSLHKKRGKEIKVSRTSTNESLLSSYGRNGISKFNS